MYSSKENLIISTKQIWDHAEHNSWTFGMIELHFVDQMVEIQMNQRVWMMAVRNDVVLMQKLKMYENFKVTTQIIFFKYITENMS